MKLLGNFTGSYFKANLVHISRLKKIENIYSFKVCIFLMYTNARRNLVGDIFRIS